MNVWSWRSAAIIWFFAWLWLQAWTGCAPGRESLSQSMWESEKEAEAEAQAAAEEEAIRQQMIALGVIEAPPEEPGFLCGIFECEEE